MNQEEQPATRADLAQLRSELGGRFTELEARLTELVRHIETSLLTAFHKYAEGYTLPSVSLPR